MAEDYLNYSNFQSDEWDYAGATAEAIKTEIARLIDNTFGNGGLSAIQKTAMEKAAFLHYEAQNAMKAAAAAAVRAASYADIPESVLFKDAEATRIAYQNIAKNLISESDQVMKNAGANAALASKIANAASALGSAINIAQLGWAASKGDAYLMALRIIVWKPVSQGWQISWSGSDCFR